MQILIVLMVILLTTAMVYWLIKKYISKQNVKNIEQPIEPEECEKSHFQNKEERIPKNNLYLDNLEKLFDKLKSKVANTMVNPVEIYLTDDEKVMDFLKDTISNGLQEQIVIMYPKLKVYRDNTVDKIPQNKLLYKAKFTIYNVKRNVSTDVRANVVLQDNEFIIKNILFVSKKENKSLGIIPEFGTNINEQEKISWIFPNTIENDTSFSIEGGVPEELIEKTI